MLGSVLGMMTQGLGAALSSDSMKEVRIMGNNVTKMVL
jgi:hypothetical protein